MDKIPPQNQEAEKQLLGSLIADPTMYYSVSGLITDQSFYATKHQLIFATIAKLVRDETPIDLLSLSEHLTGRINRSELVAITSSMPTGANAEYYAQVVAEKATRRRVINVLKQAESDVFNESTDIHDVLATAQKGLDSSLPQKRTSSEIYPAILDTLERLIDMPKGGVKNYIPTGFGKLDRQVKLTPGTLTLIAADPGVGKTSYLLSVARHVAKGGKRPLLFTLEMTREQILENIAAQELGLCHRDIINGELSAQDNDRLAAGLKKFSDLNIGVLDGRWTVSKIRHQLITEMRMTGCNCLMVDALGDIENEGGIGNKSTHEIYNDNIQQLVRVAVELKIPVLLSHHLNKSEGKRSKNNRPTRQSLMQAGDKLSHNVILLYREYLETNDQALKDKVDVIIVKARDGEVGTVQLGFNGPSKTFYNIEEHREPPAVRRGGLDG
jgi:replicative DNA helicase